MTTARSACACPNHTRSELLRASGARAGRGLPDIEPGMPVPAGTGLSRRSFLLRSLGAAMAVYGAKALAPGQFEAGIAAAAGAEAGPVLVSVFLEGGVDSLTALAPTEDSRYRALRPTLAVAPGQGVPFAEDERLRWHPTLEGLATLHAEGKVSVLPGIGYSSPDQSHFTSRHYWEVGELDPSAGIGWMGRYLDRHGTPDNPLQGLTLGDALMPALASASVPVAALSTPGEYDFSAPGVPADVEQKMMQAFAELGQPGPGDAGLELARAAVARTAALRAQAGAFQDPGAPVAYPSGDPFPARLAGLAGMLAAGFPLRCVSIQAPGGYDTHANQELTLPANLKLTADSLLSFQRDLEARGLADRVIVHLWSEFGRRPEQNASGTDHGAAGISFVIGTRARGRMVGEFPGLDQLDADDNLRNTSDFRAVYCSLLEQWLGADAGPIIPGASTLARPALIA